MEGKEQSRPWPRPLFWLTVSFAAGIAIEHACPVALPETPALSCLALLTLLLFFGSFSRFVFFRTPVLPLLIFFGLGILTCRLAAPVLPVPPLLNDFLNRPQTLYLAEVSSPPEFLPTKIQLTLRLRSALKDGTFVRVEGEALLSLNRTRTTPAAWLAGDTILARMTLKRFHNFNNPGGYDYVRNQAEKGLYARAHLPDDRYLLKVKAQPEPFPLSAFRSAKAGLDRFRQGALIWLRNSLDPDTAAFYAALLLGYQRLLSPEWQEHLSKAGVTHLLSIGGMHLGFVSLATFWLVRLLIRSSRPSILHRTCDRTIALWPALAAAAVYAFIAGFSAPPIWRSMLMLTLCLTAACSYRSPDQLSVLAAAAFVILVMDPNSLQQISFQLTFVCMFAIFSLYPRLRRFHFSERVGKAACTFTPAEPEARKDPGEPVSRLPRKEPVNASFAFLRALSAPLASLRRSPAATGILRPFEEAFWVSIAVNTLVLPLTIYYFYGISLAGFAANVLLVPAVGFAVLPPGLLSIALYAVDERIAAPVLSLGGWCLRCCEMIILWFSNLSWAFFWVGSMPLYCLAFIYAALAVGLGPWKLKVKTAVLAAVLFLFAGITAVKHGLPASAPGNRLEATVIDVGQGTSVLVKLPGGRTMLVDGGGFFDDSFDIGRAVLAPFLWHSGIRKLDYVVLTHDHPDHRNGLRFVMSHFDVGQYWENGISENKHQTRTLKDIALRRAIPHPEIGEIFGDHTVGPCSVRVVHPSPAYRDHEWDGKDMNDVSLVIVVDYGDTRLILPGDIDASVERFLFEGDSYRGSTTVVSPHHGSERSNSALMLDRVHPEAMIFSCGYDNSFGFPAEQAVQRCSERNIPMYRTDLQGAVHAISDGLKWTITTESDKNTNAPKEQGNAGNISRGGF